MKKIKVHDSALSAAAAEGMDAFLQVIVDAIKEYVGGELNADALKVLDPDHITLWGYIILRDELCDGGFIQLIHNGYGPFFFLNPFAKAMRLWGAKDFQKLIYKGRKLFEELGDELTKDCTDEEFMALFEQYPMFDDLDDEFVEMEEEVTEIVARYVDEHLEAFAEIKK